MNWHCNIALLFDAAPGWPPVSILRIVHFPQNSPSYKYTQILGNCLHTNIYKYQGIAAIKTFEHTYKFDSTNFLSSRCSIFVFDLSCIESCISSRSKLS